MNIKEINIKCLEIEKIFVIATILENSKEISPLEKLWDSFFKAEDKTYLAIRHFPDVEASNKESG